MPDTFKQYRCKELSEMRPYVKGEDMTHIAVAEVDHPETDMGMVARNPLNHLDQWYVARKYFEDNLESVEQKNTGMTFGAAISAMKSGAFVARSGWNGKGMFVYLVEGITVPVENLRGNCAKAIAASTNTAPVQDICGHIDMKAADGSIVVGWLASQTDMLANDWCIV